MYTIGIKRRFWFGYRKVLVGGHSYQADRLILNRINGAQEHITGVPVPNFMVYPDFLVHLANERSIAKAANEDLLWKQRSTDREPVDSRPTQEEQIEKLASVVDREAHRRAVQRIENLGIDGLEARPN